MKLLITLAWLLGIGAYSSSADGRGCGERIEKRTVQGNSLAGLIADGQTLRISFGFYDCHAIKRGDIVAYRYAGNATPIIKIVMGLPDDKFQLARVGRGWQIFINGKAVQNSKAETYLVDERGHRMLSLYEKDYHGIIPPQAYMLMGNLENGSLDSTRFGLIHESDILGKVLN